MRLTVDNLFVALLWMLWCALHSALVTRTVTGYVKQQLGCQYRFYRLFYNIVALVTFIPLLYYSISHRGPLVFRWEGSLVIVKYFLFVMSIYLFIAGARHYSMMQFFGIHQIKTGQTGTALSEYDTFDATGILGAVRHPWYTGGIMIIWSSDIYLTNLLSNIVISIYFVIGSFLEERKLLVEFGNQYREYRKTVSMFIPYKWLRTKVDSVRT